jgi:hypothetical protein
MGLSCERDGLDGLDFAFLFSFFFPRVFSFFFFFLGWIKCLFLERVVVVSWDGRLLEWLFWLRG